MMSITNNTRYYNTFCLYVKLLFSKSNWQKLLCSFSIYSILITNIFQHKNRINDNN